MNLPNMAIGFGLEIHKSIIQMGMLAYLFLIIPISWNVYKLESKKV
ncbi:MAG: hypothetical protein ACI9IP_001735 [Arcticibacterium sp.]|jgi:hypothetical protein